MEFKGLRLNDIALLFAFVLLTALSISAVGWVAVHLSGLTPLALLALPVGLAAVLALYLRSPRMVGLHG